MNDAFVLAASISASPPDLPIVEPRGRAAGRHVRALAADS